MDLLNMLNVTQSLTLIKSFLLELTSVNESTDVAKKLSHAGHRDGYRPSSRKRGKGDTNAYLIKKARRTADRIELKDQQSESIDSVIESDQNIRALKKDSDGDAMFRIIKNSLTDKFDVVGSVTNNIYGSSSDRKHAARLMNSLTYLTADITDLDKGA